MLLVPDTRVQVMAGAKQDRAVSTLVGAVFLFGTVIILFSVYQASIVPSQNEKVEFQHSQNIQEQMINFRGGALTAAATDTTITTRVTLGTTFPPRVFGVNPPPASGTLRTTHLGGGTTLSIDNARASDTETADYWNGDQRGYATKAFVYEPSYTEYQNAPTTTYEHTVLYNEFRSGQLTKTDQRLVDGRELDLTVLQGEYQASQSGAASVSLSSPAGNVRTVTVQRTSAGNPVTISFPTGLSKEKWESLLEDELVTRGGYIDSVTYSSGVLTLELAETDADGNPIVYELRTSSVGVGTTVPDPAPQYLVDISGDGTEVETGETTTLEAGVNNKFNGPESGVTLSASASSGSGAVTGPTDEKGHSTIEYTAPSTAGTYTVTVERDLDGSGTVEADEQVQFTVSVVSSSSGSGDSTAPIFTRGPSANPSTVNRGDSFDLSATIDDTNRGGTDIVSADWADTEDNSGILKQDDGEFDQPTERVSNRIFTDGWSKGDHTITVEGSDANGNTVSDTVTVTVNTGDPLPSDAVAFNDTNRNGLFDDGETTYTERQTSELQDESVNLVIEKDVTNNKIQIKTRTLTVRGGVSITSDSNELKMTTTGGNVDVSGTTLTAGKNNQARAITLISAGDVDARDTNFASSGPISAEPANANTLFVNDNGGDRADGGTYVEDLNGNPTDLSLGQGSVDGSPEKGQVIDNS